MMAGYVWLTRVRDRLTSSLPSRGAPCSRSAKRSRAVAVAEVVVADLRKSDAHFRQSVGVTGMQVVSLPAVVGAGVEEEALVVCNHVQSRTLVSQPARS